MKKWEQEYYSYNKNNIAEEKIKELEEKCFEISIKVSKCNMVASNLMKGLSWDEIELKFENWNDRTYTSSEKLSKLSKDDKTKNNIQEENSSTIIEETQDVFEDDKGALMPVSKFATKHPHLAKIGDFFGKFKDLFKRNNVKNEGQEQVEEADKEDFQSKSERDDFLQYLKDVAEKGVDGEKKERKEQKLKDAKIKAHQRETQKYGKDYADKSYRIDEEEL